MTLVVGSKTRPLDGNLPPLDQSDRQRLRSELDRTFFVEAGAGTGKTTALVGRIVALVAANCLSLERLAAITFTEAAAAELRDRIRRGLEKAAHDPARPAEERERCREAVAEVDLAAIQTIHAFANTLLRTFPIEAGLPPGFEVWDSIQSDLAFEERFRSWLFDEIPSDTPANRVQRDTLRRALLLGMSFDQLRLLAKQLGEHLDLLTPETTWTADPPTPAYDVARRLGAELVALSPLLIYAKQGEKNPLVKEVRRLEPAAQRLIEARDEADALLALQLVGPIKHGLSSQANWEQPRGIESPIKTIKNVLKDAKETTAETLRQHCASALADILHHLRDFTLGFARERRDKGVATFNDLLVWARALLRDRPDVCRQAQHRFSHIFVDEFQDTDPLQAEIAWLLAADPDEPADSWQKAPLKPGKLFIVGDPKQSIYRFRGADVSVYAEIYQQANPDDRVWLTQNFRSLPPILAWVNYQFQRDMRSEPGVQAPYVDLQPSETCTASDRSAECVQIIGGPVDGNAKLVRQHEADAVGQIARQVIAEKWQVRDKSGDWRDATFSDVCVLTPRRTNLPALEGAFEQHGIPYRIEGGSLVLDTQEVRDLLSCLRAIDDPSDQVALVAALRSPAYACSDVELLEWVETGGKLDYESVPDEHAGAVADALRSLRAFHRDRATRSAAATIEAFIRDRMLAVQAFGLPHPREAWRRLRYVVSQARALAAVARPGLRALVDWLEGLQRAAIRDPESPLPEPDEEAVRVLTVHAAKGLEFPIVILTGLGSPRRDPPTSVRILTERHTRAIEVRCSDFETSGYQAVKDAEKVQEDAEEVRLLYVAATRARDSLVLCLHHADNKSGKGSPAARLSAGFAEYDRLAFRVREPKSGPDRPEPIWSNEPPLSVEEHVRAEQEWLKERETLVARLAAAPVLTASKLVIERPSSERPVDVVERLDDPGPRVAETEADFDEEILPMLDPELAAEPPSADRAARIGQAVHAVLERLEWQDLASLTASVATMARRYGVVEQQTDIAHLVRAILANPRIRQAARTRQVWQEVPVGIEIDGVILEGRIDLLYEVDGGLAIVDFKTDRIGREAIAERVTSYAIQLGAYAIAIERILNRPVRRLEIIFAALDGHVETIDGEQAKRQALSRLQQWKEQRSARLAPRSALSR